MSFSILCLITRSLILKKQKPDTEAIAFMIKNSLELIISFLTILYNIVFFKQIVNKELVA